MFKKLLSNLPFNPSLITQVSFYARRLRAESSIRRLGLFFVIASIAVQLLAVTFPTEPTLAGDVNNDVIPGGFSSQAEAVNHCSANNYDFQTILAYFGITCDKLAEGSVRRIDYAEYDGRLHSMGRLSYFANDHEVSIPNAGTFYMRPLTNWGAHCWNDGKNCQAITGTRNDNTPFMVLFSCGNITIVGEPTPPPPPPPPPPPTPDKAAICSNLMTSFVAGGKVIAGRTITVRGQAVGSHLTPEDKVTMRYTYLDAATNRQLGSQQVRDVSFTNAVAQDNVPRSFKLDKPGQYLFHLTVIFEGKEVSGSNTGNCAKLVTVEPPCDSANNSDATSCLIMNKTASNDTQNITDANNTTASAGDHITYTLSVTNSSKNTAVDEFIFAENIADILEYADVVNLFGGTLEAQNVVRWPSVKVAANQTVEKKITVQIKNPIPQTPIAASNPQSFDLTMTNVFHGNVVNVKLSPSIVKTTEQINRTLPKTGPGEAIAVGLGIAIIAGYFFARNRLMAKELDIVIRDNLVSE